MPNKTKLNAIIGAYIALILAAVGVVKACESATAGDVMPDAGVAGAPASEDAADGGSDEDAGN